MRDLTERERAALDAVAEHVAASWENGDDHSDAYFTVAGERIAADVETLKYRPATQDAAARPRLRFDKVATRIIENLRSALQETLPDGLTLLFTVTAPIRLPSKTAATIQDKIQTLFARGSKINEEADVIHGNRVRLRLVPVESTQATKLIGFVHNPDTDPNLLLNLTSELLGVIDTGAASRPHDRWLVVSTALGRTYLETFRHINSQLPMPSDLKKIYLVFGDGKVEPLSA
jgi:hypothetical protein